jgi:hypothetical protein
LHSNDSRRNHSQTKGALAGSCCKQPGLQSRLFSYSDSKQKQQRNFQSTTFSQHGKSHFNIQELKSRFNTRTQRTFQRKSHYALKGAKHARHAEAAKNAKTKTRRAR